MGSSWMMNSPKAAPNDSPYDQYQKYLTWRRKKKPETPNFNKQMSFKQFNQTMNRNETEFEKEDTDYAQSPSQPKMPPINVSPNVVRSDSNRSRSLSPKMSHTLQSSADDNMAVAAEAKEEKIINPMVYTKPISKSSPKPKPKPKPQSNTSNITQIRVTTPPTPSKWTN